MRLITKPDEARRLARTILSDILLYNQAKVKEGIEKDSLFDILTEELAEGKNITKPWWMKSSVVIRIFLTRRSSTY